MKSKSASPSLRPRLRVLWEDEIAFSPGKAELLRKRLVDLFYDGHVQAIRTTDLSVRNSREPGSEPAVAGYPGE